jgi:hypothetical protein
VRLSQVGRPPTFCTYEQEGDCEATDRIYKLDGVKDKKGRVSKMVDLSESAKTILRHFKVRGMHEKDYETPAALGQLFNVPQECESAEAELVTAGLVDLAAGPGGHIPVRKWNRIRGAALTLDGERYVAQNRL